MARRRNELSTKELSQLRGTIRSDKYEFDELLELFIDDGEIRNLRDHTIKYYRNELTTFRRLLESQDIDTQPAKITPEHVKENVIRYMKDRQQAKTVSINTRLRAIRAFFNYLHKERYIPNNPIKEIKLLKDRKTIIATLSNDQIRKLFRQPNLKTFIGVRDLTIMMLLLETGIRANELVGLSLGDIRWDDSQLLIRNAKGHRERLVPFQARMKDQFKKYIAIRGVIETDALFITIDNTPLTKRQLQARITFYGREASIDNVRCSCHTLRHTFAKLSVQNGAGIFELQQILGHTTMEMVRTYVNLYSTEVRDKHKSFSPLTNLK
ncbi:tyrosine-type recombinase/integrase [Fictibacillus norfolkensis]|uniref:Tyrosine-type recombinase/integrase n=1 Tax=Fictibacillus norfolkensis TaxID=2762233 RepID=A0ABR8SPG1_9BACL|nr:tyrosine-type recombinase/integrase [Fictibacillus norfolkensis]MBD7965378.1 tyrosine-type recombinase/integrase [Fictibacillus norfolkensis]